MRLPTSFKQDFLKKWALGLQYYGATSSSSSSNNMSFLQRKKAIKLSADVAMASARDGNKTSWSRALIYNISKQDENKGLVRRILGSDEFDQRVTSSTITTKASTTCNKRVRSKKILRRSHTMRRISKCVAPGQPGPRPGRRVIARSIAKRMVKRRTQVLKGLVPGGDNMDDEFTLIKETLDYMISLQAQVDIMHKVFNACKLPNLPNQK